MGFEQAPPALPLDLPLQSPKYTTSVDIKECIIPILFIVVGMWPEFHAQLTELGINSGVYFWSCMTYTIPLDFLRQNEVGGVMWCQLHTQMALYSIRKSYKQYSKPLDSILVQSVEFLRKKTHNDDFDMYM